MKKLTYRPSIEALEPRNTPSNTVLIASPRPAVVGQTVLLTATVTANGTDTLQPGAGVDQFQTPLPGTVTFFDGATPLGPPVTVTPSATKGRKGSAQFLASGLGVGTHSFTASYSGEMQFDLVASVVNSTGASTSAAVPEVVNQPAPLKVTGSVTVTLVKLRPLRRRFNLHNNGATLSGPVFVVLRGLTPKVTLTNASGKTTSQGHIGDPFVRLDVSQLLAGQDLDVLLTFANPRHKQFVFSTAVFAGPGSP